ALQVVDPRPDMDTARQDVGSSRPGRTRPACGRSVPAASITAAARSITAAAAAPVERRKPRQRVVDLGHRPDRPVVADSLYEIGVEVDGIDEAEEGRAGIEIRDDRSRLDLLSAVQHD